MDRYKNAQTHSSQSVPPSLRYVNLILVYHFPSMLQLLVKLCLIYNEIIIIAIIGQIMLNLQ